MVATRRLRSLVETALARADFPPGQLTVALSGGADSAALAHLALSDGREVSAHHVDHGLAGSVMLRGAAVTIAGALGIPLDVTEVTVGEGASIEEMARDARYRALERLEGAVVTGHTRDDNAETVLINLMRGAGTGGLGGIPPHRPPNVFRPILEVTRSETREIATLAGLPFRDDPMNDDLGLTRNRVRHRLLPLMTEINPRVVESLANTARVAREDAELLERLAGSPSLTSGLPVALVITSPGPLADRLICRLLQESGIGVTAGRVALVRDVASGGSPRQDLAEGLSVVRRGALLVIE
jgi:tRNA(Ile)-lysidine synthase